jgi:thioredoxin-related protein
MKHILLITLLLASLFLVGCGPSQSQLEGFATCLTEKGATMYGASWCPHCQDQKKEFGDAFNKINYVECSTEEQKCQDAGIQYLPTWEFSDGSTRTGVVSFSELAEKTSCVLE